MEQQFLNHHHSATFASPATPNYKEEEEERGVEMVPKGWSSERVPLSKYNNHRSRHVASSTVALFPFSSGRTLPSKWDDAEKWICSPVFGQDGSYSSKSLQLAQSERRAKSKSGPLGPQMLGNYGNYSPVTPTIFGGGSSMAADSPLLGTSNNGYGGGRRNSCPGNEQDLACTREWLKLLNDPSGTESQEDKSDGANEEESQVRRVASRRDMGTQMLPSEGSSTTSYSSPPHATATNELPEMDEVVKDVKVDKEDTLPIRRSIKQNSKSRSNRSSSSNDYNNGSITESGLRTSKLQREEEARINEWENLQREKADAAIQKLEMMLETKRARSMEKIMKKLKRAELKAEMMRSSLSQSNGGRNQTRQSIVRLYRRIRMALLVGEKLLPF